MLIRKTILFFILIITIVTFSLPLKAQTKYNFFQKWKLKREARGYFWDENYRRAVPLYEKLDSLYPDKIKYKYRLGVSYLKTGLHKKKALNILQKSKEQTREEGKEYNYRKVNYYLARAFHLNHEFEKAISHYQVYAKEGDIDLEELVQVNKKILRAKNGGKLITSPVNIVIENIGAPVNTSYDEYSPVVPQDESFLIFTTRREGNLGGLMNVHGQSDPYGTYFEDIYVSHRRGTKWSDPKGIGEPINTTGHEATIGLSPDGNKLFIYYSDARRFGDIYVSKLKDKKWSEPQRLDDKINSDYWEGSASITEDGSTLYFSSNRPGGFGGKDIYISRKNEEGEWGEPVNLGEKINTADDEDAAFILPDGKTLYFSSTGHNSMGGYDIFISEKDNDQWLRVKNIGYPLNTADDDLYFVYTVVDRRGYFSSVREGGVGNHDIYIAYMPKEIGSMPVLFQINDDKQKKSVIVRTDSQLTDICSLLTTNPKLKAEVYPFRDNSVTQTHDAPILRRVEDVAEIMLECGIEKNRLQVSKIFRESEEIALKNIADTFSVAELTFAPSETDVTTTDTDVFSSEKPVKSGKVATAVHFPLNSYTLLPEAKQQLDKISDKINKTDRKIKVEGYTDNTGNPAFNKKLSLFRAEAVAGYLAKKGISKEKIEIRAYGESNPVADNDTEEGRRKNRRVNIVVK